MALLGNLLSLNPTSIAIKLGIAAFALSVVVGGYYYVQNLRSEVQIAQATIEQKQRVIEAKDLQIVQSAQDAELSRTLNSDISSKWAEAQEEKRQLTEQLNGIQANFKQMLRDQPKQMEVKINQDTKFSLRCNELVTGALLNMEDDMNTICPDLIRVRKAQK